MFYGYLLKVACEVFVVFDYILYNFLMRQFILTSTYIIINYLSSRGILLLMKHLMPCIKLHNSHGLYHIIYWRVLAPTTSTTTSTSLARSRSCTRSRKNKVKHTLTTRNKIV